MDVADVASMTGEALNLFEDRVMGRFERVEDRLYRLEHAVQQLDIKIDVRAEMTDQKLDRGFTAIMEYIDGRMDGMDRHISTMGGEMGTMGRAIDTMAAEMRHGFAEISARLDRLE